MTWPPLNLLMRLPFFSLPQRAYRKRAVGGVSLLTTVTGLHDITMASAIKLVFVLFLSIVSIQASKFKVTEQVYFDVNIGDTNAGRIVLGLFGEIAPRTVKNFVTIASEGLEGKTYADSKFHRVIKKFMIQGGDIAKQDGTGSTSIYGAHFADENFTVKHTGPGFVSMANSGKDTNGCQFFITTIATPWLDGHHTVFGKVVEGQDVVHKIEQTPTDPEDRPIKPVVIVTSGLVPTPTPFFVSDEPYE